MRHCFRLTLAAVALLAAAFAPVPPPRTGTAEAVVNGFGAGAAGVRRQLLHELLPTAIHQGQLRGLASLKGARNPSEWLGRHLKTEELAPGGPVRVQLSGCSPKEALALLKALTRAYETNRRTRHLYEVELVAAVQLQIQAQQGAGVPIMVTMPANRRSEGPAVLQQPKLISEGKAR